MEMNRFLVVYDPKRDEQPALERAAMIAWKVGASIHLYAAIHHVAVGADPESEQVELLIKQEEKRLEKRLNLMSAGAEEFETWLCDLYRKGFAAARQQPYGFWEQPAARLLDSQLPGLAQRVREVPSRLYGDDWADVLLTETGRWFIAVRAWKRRDELDDADLANLRVFLGWPIPTDEVRATEPIHDTWVVRGLHRTDDGRLKSQRTWLLGTTTGTQALLLDFAAAGAFLDAGHVVGSQVTGPLALYPGSGIRRGLFTDEGSSAGSTPTIAVNSISA